MKMRLCFLLSLLIAHVSLGQTTETFLSLNSGLFSFKGTSADKSSQINLYNSSSTGYTNNPFGAENGLCYGLSYHIQHIAKRNFIAGIGLGYENLRSKVTLSSVNGSSSMGTFQEVAVGQTYLSNHIIDAFPYLGYRTAIRQLRIDLTGGFDLGYLFNSHENGSAKTATGQTYSTSLDRTYIKFDVRPRLQASVFYGKIGAYIGYAYGLMNYRSGWVGGQNQCHSEVIRFGILYKGRQ